jgi:hypothetical protein
MTKSKSPFKTDARIDTVEIVREAGQYLLKQGDKKLEYYSNYRDAVAALRAKQGKNPS